MNIIQTLTSLLQYSLPHHFLSALVSKFTHSEIKIWKNLMISQIIKFYKVDIAEARQTDINSFASFNHFFTRELKPGIRPISPHTNAIACPADGEISQTGIIDQGEIFQAKGKSFSTLELLGGNKARAESFMQGSFTTIYLSPKDYHRLHMPVQGSLTEMIHIPGRLFSVSHTSANSIPNLFARNERVVCMFDTELGCMALILVGAIFVSSIETTWHGVVTPPTSKAIRSWQYQNNRIIINKGDEMGRFNMGSTIIVLFAKDKMTWNEKFIAGKKVKLGEVMGEGWRGQSTD